MPISPAKGEGMTTITTVVFDAYGTLLDVSAAARKAGLGPVWPDLSQVWRAKQLEYSWLRALTGQHADFWQVTAEALDYALEACGLDDPTLPARLMDLYRHLDPYPETVDALCAARARGLNTAILSNGSPTMLAEAVSAAGLTPHLDDVLSVETVGIYKPAPQVYDLATARFACAPQEILFVSSNGWDIAGAGAFGCRTLWVNRAGAPVDRMPARPDVIRPDLTTLDEVLTHG